MRPHDKRQNRALWFLLCAALSGCGDSGKQSAAHWLSAQQSEISVPAASAVPEYKDTPPATYDSQVLDPFSPTRVAARLDDANKTSKAGVLFPDAALSDLLVVGYFSEAGKTPVAMMRYGNQYRNIHVGERIGDQTVLVKQIGMQGVLVQMSATTEQWLPINKP